MNEAAINFECNDTNLIGILHGTHLSAATVGVVIIVGGPQYRLGSHRQFVLQARDFATLGIPCFRFDYRGMGDSEGDSRDFREIEDDIQAALNAFQDTLPNIEKFVLWGLCDAASASMMYAATDKRVCGMVLLNPWVRNENSLAQAYVSDYYPSHISSKQFWRKLFSGKINLFHAITQFLHNIIQATQRTDTSDTTYIDKMLHGLQQFAGESLVILSGEDLTAGEFKNLVSANKQWQTAMRSQRVTVQHLKQANHTFASQVWRDQVSQWTCNWLKVIASNSAPSVQDSEILFDPKE